MPSVSTTIRSLPVCLTTIYSYLYHRHVSHINITYLFHITKSHIYITHPTFPPVFTAVRTCHCSQQNILHDLPLLSAKHSTRPATALCRTFYRTCHCSLQNILQDLPLFSAEHSTRPITALSRTFYATCDCSQQYVLYDPPLCSAEHSTRPDHCATLGKFLVIWIIGMFIMKTEKLQTFVFIFYLNRRIKFNKEKCSLQQRFQQKSPAARDHVTLRGTMSHCAGPFHTVRPCHTARPSSLHGTLRPCHSIFYL